MTMTSHFRAMKCHTGTGTKAYTGQLHTVAGLSLIHGNAFVWISFMLQSLKPGRLDLKQKQNKISCFFRKRKFSTTIATI